MRSVRLTASVLVVGVGCLGTVEDTTSGGGSACDDTSVSDLRRLPAVHYQNTVADLFAGAPALDVQRVAGPQLARVPADGAPGQSYSRMDHRLSPAHAEAYYQVAAALARELQANAEARAQLLGACANDARLTASCIDSILDGFVMRAFRRPLDDVERQRLRALDDGVRTGPELVYGLVFTALLSPQFLFLLEVDGESLGSDDLFAVDGFGLASRLSYHFWRTMPDQELFDAAADGSLLTDEGYAAQVERVFADPRTRETVKTFYREWLYYGQVGGFPDTVVFDAFAPADLQARGQEYLTAMREEVDALLEHYTWEADGDMAALLLSDLSVTRSDLLAGLYGVAPWDGVSPMPRFPAGTRSGLLTRAAFLVTGRHTTNPVFRGAVVRRRILCYDIHPPDPTTLPPGSLDPPEFRVDMTTRQRYEAKTQEEPCASCHQLINPIGFVFERFDALGRARTHEVILDEVTGQELASLELDTRVQPNLTPGDTTEVSEPGELMQRVADSGLVEECFARQYFRFSYGREDAAEDACTIASIRSGLESAADGSAGPGTLREALRAIALHPSFRRRAVGPR